MRRDPSSPVLKIPADLYERYQRGVSGPEGALDDSRKQVRNGLIVLIGFFVVLLGWAALAPLSGAAVASGVVTVAGNRQTLQTLNGGAVAEILVTEGQRVRAGQILMRLNPLSTGSTLRQSQAERDALAATESRLMAERDGADTITWPADFAARQGEAGVSQAMASQAALFDTRSRLFASERATEQAAIADARIAVEGPRRQLAFVDERVVGMRQLFRNGFAPKSVLFELEASKVALETQIAQARVGLRTAELAFQRAEAGRVTTVQDELRQVQAQLQQVVPVLEAARFASDLNVMRAPVEGAVVGLVPVAPGSILSPGQTLMDILPSGRTLIVEARLSPDDADDVRVGAVADVRFTTVNPRGMDKIEGEVIAMSADRLTDPGTGVPYYLARIALNPAQLTQSGVQLSAGLPASVNVRTHDRTFLNFILAPLTDTVAKAGRQE